MFAIALIGYFVEGVKTGTIIIVIDKMNSTIMIGI